MKLIKNENVLTVDRQKQLREPLKGYSYGVFTIHKNEHKEWSLSAKCGANLIFCRTISDAQAAAQAFALLPIDWELPLDKIQAFLNNRKNKAIAVQCSLIRSKYRKF